ncbi:18839_t:CDS:1 [Racocetra fulgida]|uniref:18839_t:CDS:1 n=1 Tax=Racocetra fulgida TaxID=60492 RepID=A0A9N9DKZ0_9GLOM|nr:18839_t:CDS:1 [Racocetra fulgida]
MSDQYNLESQEAVHTNVENEAVSLFKGKVLTSWETCNSFITEWARKRGFNIIKDRVHCKENVIRRRTYICEHGRNYETNSEKETSTKKILCKWHVNASCPKLKNPNSAIFINTIVDEHNHLLNVDAITFETEKKFSIEMIEDVKFLTQHCKMGSIAQMKYLEGKYPAHPIYKKDLYAIIRSFRPTTMSLMSDATQMSNWLDSQKEKDPR